MKPAARARPAPDGPPLVARIASPQGRPALQGAGLAVLGGWRRLFRRSPFRRSGPGSRARASLPVLAVLPGGETRCVACYLCTAACPSECISVEAAAPASPASARFDIDMGRCLQCGLCVEACPLGALALVVAGSHAVEGQAMVASDTDALRSHRRALLRPA